MSDESDDKSVREASTPELFAEIRRRFVDGLLPCRAKAKSADGVEILGFDVQDEEYHPDLLPRGAK